MNMGVAHRPMRLVVVERPVCWKGGFRWNMVVKHRWNVVVGQFHCGEEQCCCAGRCKGDVRWSTVEVHQMSMGEGLRLNTVEVRRMNKEESHLTNKVG